MTSAAPTAVSHGATRRMLIAVELFLALNAVAGAVYAFGGAKGVKREWLDGTPFDDYVIPGVILLVVVGGSLGAAATVLLRRVPDAWAVSVAAGTVVIGWLIVETLMIGVVSWMQPTTFAVALVIIGLAIRLKPASDRGA